MDRRHIMPQPGCDEVVTICEVCHDFKLCLDFKVPQTLESTQLPSILCEECLDNFDVEVQKFSSEERRQIMADLLIKSEWDMNEIMNSSREIATFTMDRLINTIRVHLEDLNDMTDEFPVPFAVDNTLEPKDRLAVRKKQASMAIMIFLLQEELRARTEVSNEEKAD